MNNKYVTTVIVFLVAFSTDVFAQTSLRYRRDGNTVIEEIYEDGKLIETKKQPDLVRDKEEHKKSVEQALRNMNKIKKEYEISKQQNSCAGKSDGEHKYYRDDGKIKFIINCLLEKKHGVQKTYDSLRGRLFREEHYYSGNKYDMQKRYQLSQLKRVKTEHFKYDKLRYERMHLDGEWHGDYKVYSEDGKLLWETQFNHGEQSELIKTYYPLSSEEESAGLTQVPYQLLIWKNEYATVSNCIFDECESARNMVFNDSRAYNQRLMEFVSKEYYPDFVFPEIDFGKYTVLGNYVSGSCASYFERIVTRDDIRKIYKYTVVVNHPFCRTGPGKTSLNLIAIPKISDEYAIEFDVQDPGSGTVEIIIGR